MREMGENLLSHFPLISRLVKIRVLVARGELPTRVEMWKDEILEKIYRIREEHAKSFDYDLQAICNDLRKKQAER